MMRWEKLSGTCTQRNEQETDVIPATSDADRFLDVENGRVTELITAIGSQRQALKLIGLSRSTWHYRCQAPRAVADKLQQKRSRLPVTHD